MSDAFETNGAFSWCELLTDDVDNAKQFYSEVFDWELEDMDMPTGKYTVIKVNEKPIGGLMKKPDEAAAIGTPNFWGSYVTVDDVDARVEKARSRGAEVLVPPTDVPTVGRFSTIKDPSGAVLSLITSSQED